MNERRKVKIAFVLVNNLRTGAGTENVVKSFIHNYPSTKFEVTIVQPPTTSGIRMEEKEYKYINEQVKVLTLKSWPLEKFDFIPRYLPLEFLFYKVAWPFIARWSVFKNREIFKEIADFDFIYIVFNWLVYLFNDFKGKIIGTNHTDFCLKEHNKYSFVLANLIKSGLLFRKISAFHLHPNAISIREKIKKGKNIVLPPRGVDCNIYYPRETHKGKVKFLFVSRLTECKGVKFLLELWEEFKNNANVEFIIVGSGPLASDVSKHSLGNLKYLGVLSEEELSRIYGESDIFLAPTNCDTFPTVVWEGFASGVHAIVNQDLVHVFDDFSNKGYLTYLPLDREIWIKQINSSINNIQKIRDNRTSLRDYFVENYTDKVITEKLFDWINKLQTN